MKSELLTRAMHTRGALVLAIIIAAASALAAYMSGIAVTDMSAQGFVSIWSGEWAVSPRLLSCGIESGLLVLIMALLLHLSKAYNLMRATSRLHCTLFLIITVATPSLLVALCPGTVLCAILLLCIAILYNVYVSGVTDTRKIFLVFAILSGCAAFDATYVVYLSTMFVACFQLRLFSLRSFLAILMGVVTPWVIYIGFGLAPIYALQVPDWRFRIPDLHEMRTQILLITVALTIFLTLSSLLQNIYKIISYNAQSRALLSVITVNTFITMIAAALDIDDIYSYITILNLLAAFQIAHMFVAIHNFRKSYIGILWTCALYLGILFWRTLL